MPPGCDEGSVMAVTLPDWDGVVSIPSIKQTIFCWLGLVLPGGMGIVYDGFPL